MKGDIAVPLPLQVRVAGRAGEGNLWTRGLIFVDSVSVYHDWWDEPVRPLGGW